MRLPSAALLLIASFLLATTAVAGDRVRDERRLWSDGSPQEVWTYDGSIVPENLVLQELFWEDGKKRSRTEFVAGVQHGPARTWYPSGNKEIEETWVDGGRSGTVTHWPDPGTDARLRKQLKPTLEAGWADGKPHGPWREWKGWGEDRRLSVDKRYAEGELDGSESVWRSADSLNHKHSWKRGRLHGRQLGWDGGGEMAYQYNFVDGEPEGPQRKYQGDTILQELFFVEGRLHGEMTWERWLLDLGPSWRHGVRTDERRDDDGKLVTTRRYTFVPGERFDHEGRLQFLGEQHLVDTTKYHDDGSRKTVKVEGSPGRLLSFFPSGRLQRIEGEGAYAGPVFELHPDGTLFREEHWDGGKRVGTWQIRDLRGRVVQVQRWDFYLQEQTVTLWHDAGTKAGEGHIEHHSDSPDGRKDGTWTYWRPDGSLLRTEEYGPGPYSGNRPFIVKMVEYDEQERPRFEGSERELFLYDYDDEDPELVRRKRTIKLLDRSRFRVERWAAATRTMERTPVTKPTELVEGAPVVELIGDRGLVLVDERFRRDGSPKQTEHYGRAGERSGVQEGWYRDGTRAYAFEYSRGVLSTAREWWSDGSPRLVLFAHDGELRAMDASDRGGKHWVVDGRTREWRGPKELLERCRLWEFDSEAPRPGG